MAVVIKYVVVRNGEEKMTFATKKEADAHDRMLDIADNLYDFIGRCEGVSTINDSQRETLSLYLAKNSDQVMSILRGIPFKQAPHAASVEGSDIDAEAQSAVDAAGEDRATAGGGDAQWSESVSEPPPTEKKRGAKSKSSRESNIDVS